jgi:hypothetical protein
MASKSFALRALVATVATAAAWTLPAQAQSYNPGTTYPNPSGAARAPCNDPWVSAALEIVHGRADPALCAVGLYRGGSWGSFNELVHAVAATRNALSASGTSLRVVPVRGANFQAIGVYQGGSLVAAGGGNLVAAGGGNLVAAGGGNLILANNQLVAAGGGNLVSPGGGNLAPVASLGSGYSLQSASKRIALPVGGIAIR